MYKKGSVVYRQVKKKVPHPIHPDSPNLIRFSSIYSISWRSQNQYRMRMKRRLCRKKRRRDRTRTNYASCVGRLR